MYKRLNTGTVAKRTGKNTVAIVGFAATTRHLAPWEDTATEIWGLNEAYLQEFMKRWDRWFQLHPEENFNRDNNHNDPNHPQWLRERHGFPIYMQKKFDYIPDSIEYPLAEVIKKFGNYLTSSFAFMFALAMLEGFERIELYGFEMGTFTEYHYQKAGAEYLIGMARGMGIEVYMPPESTLCKGKMYGYESMDVPFRQSLEYRKEGVNDELPGLRDAAMVERGKLAKVEEIVANPDLDLITHLEEQKKKTDLAVGKYNMHVGILFDVGEIIKLYDKFLENTGVIPKQDNTKHEEYNDQT